MSAVWTGVSANYVTVKDVFPSPAGCECVTVGFVRMENRLGFFWFDFLSIGWIEERKKPGVCQVSRKRGTDCGRLNAGDYREDKGNCQST
jgi:hypothetical protein